MAEFIYEILEIVSHLGFYPMKASYNVSANSSNIMYVKLMSTKF